MPKMYANFDLVQNELQNVRLQNLVEAPGSPVAGQFYFNTTTNQKLYYNGSSWEQVSDSSITNTKLSNIATQRVKGRVSAETGQVEDLTPADVRQIINVEDGAAADQSAAEVPFDSSENDFTATDVQAAIEEVGSLVLGDITAASVSYDSTLTSLTATNVQDAIDEILDGAGVGTVTQVSAGDGMDFTAITGNGSVVLGIPSTVTGVTTNSLTSDSHTHALTITSTDVGLQNVTNDAQIKKASATTIGNIPVWSVITGDELGTGYGVETDLTAGGSSDNLVRADAAKAYIDGILATNDAMIFKGTIGTGGTVTTLPTTHDVGWTYKVITAGTYAGKVCEIGDMIISLISREGSANEDADWAVVQANIDGAVTGPSSATNDSIAVFDGTTGKVIKDGGKTIATLTSDAADAVDVKTLDTDNTTAQATNATETIKGTGSISLHKIAKTGTYSDLIGTPTIGDATITIAGGTDLSGEDTFTVNQVSNATATINHANVTRSDTTTGDKTVKGGDTIAIVDSVSASSTGHVTATNTKTVTLDSSLARKKAADIVGGSTTWDFEHNLSTLDVTVNIYDKTTNEIVYTDISIINTNTVRVTFATTIPSDTFRIVVVG